LHLEAYKYLSINPAQCVCFESNYLFQRLPSETLAHTQDVMWICCFSQQREQINVHIWGSYALPTSCAQLLKLLWRIVHTVIITQQDFLSSVYCH